MKYETKEEVCDAIEELQNAVVLLQKEIIRIKNTRSDLVGLIK